MDWCYATASVTGTSHLRAGTRIQDAKRALILGDTPANRVFFAVIADGAGSAARGGQGASLICRVMTASAREAVRNTRRLPSDEEIWSWVDIARDRIQIAASRRGLLAREFASTMILVLVSPIEIATAHIGDGAVVARRAESAEWDLLSAPHHGDYASTTFFLTDDPSPALRISRRPNEHDRITLFSDGIEHLAIDSVTGTPFAGFFNPVSRPLCESITFGEDKELSTKLASFLASERVNEHTDDDKTLVVMVAK